MRTTLKMLLPLFTIGIIGIIGYQVTAKLRYKKEVAENIKALPPFSFKTLEGKTFTRKDIDKSKALIFIYFNSDCHYCQNEAEQIAREIDVFKNTQLFFVSTEAVGIVKDFARHYNLDTHAHITFILDTEDRFATVFDANHIPFILIYDRRQHLVAKFKGQVKTETLLKVLEDNG